MVVKNPLAKSRVPAKSFVISTLTTGGANKETIQIPNVLFVDRKMKAIERLIAVKPDEVRVNPG